jgi:hypothetical protein
LDCFATSGRVSPFSSGLCTVFKLIDVNRVDKPALRIPKSFADLQALNTLLKKYRDIYPFRIVICYVAVYLLCVLMIPESLVLLILGNLSLQAFTLPGSMYLSILAGAIWGMPRAIPLACSVSILTFDHWILLIRHLLLVRCHGSVS